MIPGCGMFLSSLSKGGSWQATNATHNRAVEACLLQALELNAWVESQQRVKCILDNDKNATFFIQGLMAHRKEWLLKH